MKERERADDIVLSEAQVRDVIERATRVVPEKTGLTVSELRQIAIELDIDSRAFEAALDRVVGLPVTGQPIRSWFKRGMATVGRLADSFLPQSGRLIGIALCGGIAGWLNAFLLRFSLNGHYPVAAAMIGLTVANLLSRRLDRNLPRFLVETFAQWGAYGLLWSFTYGQVTQNLVLWIVLWTTLATISGFLLVRDSSRGDGHSQLQNGDARVTSKKSDERQRLKHLAYSPIALRAGY